MNPGDKNIIFLSKRPGFFLVLMVIWMFFTSNLQGQTPIFYPYTVDNGLSSSTVYKVFQDSRGYIWFGTETGVDRFNGSEFLNFGLQEGLPGLKIYEIYEDHRDRLWLISDNGMLCYIHQGKVFKPSFPAEVLNNILISIYQDMNGDYYVISKDGIVYQVRNDKIVYKYGKPTNKYPAYISRIIEWPQNNLWGISQSGFQKLKDGKIIGSIAMKTSIKVRKRILKVDNGLLIASESGLAWLKDTSIIPVFRNTPVNTEVFSLYLKKNGTLWLGAKNGLYYYPDKSFSSQPKLFLKDKLISSIMEDNEGNLWCATLGDGVYFLPADNLLSYNQDIGLKRDNILCIFGDSSGGSIWAGDDKGNYYHIEGEKVTIGSIPAATIYSRIKIIKAKNKDIVLGTDHGIILLRNGAQYIIPELTAIKDILFQGNDILVANTVAGMVRLKPEDIMQNIKPPGGTKIKGGLCLAASGNRLWYGAKSGVYEIIKDSCVPVVVPGLSPGIGISKMAVDGQGNLWLASQGQGVFIYKNGKAIQLTEKEGLGGNYCNSLVYRDNICWVAGNKGFTRISIEDGKYRLRRYGYTEGLASNEVNDLFADNKGRVWAATTRGITMFSQGALSDKIHRPLINLETIFINDVAYPVRQNMVLPFDSNYIKVKYSGISYKSRGKLKFKFRLKGLDSNWIYTGNSYLRYTTLPFGDYTLLLKAVAENGTESEKEAEFHFVIDKKPFLQRKYVLFGILSGVLGLTLLIFLVISLIRRQEKKNYAIQRRINESEIKALRAQMNPHFIFNSLNSIQSFILSNDKRSANLYLTKFANLMRQMLANSREASISLKQETEFLNLYLELEGLRFEERLSYEIYTDSELNPDSVFLPSMVIQPLVENAIKHGIANTPAGGTIEIRFENKQGHLHCTIIDTGVGRKKAREIAARNPQRHTGSGINAAMERLQLLKYSKNIQAEFNITDLEDASGKATGTLVELTIPIYGNDQQAERDA